MAVFEDIYRLYGKKVYLYLLSLTGNPSEAEELLSETFYRAFLHIDSFEERCSIYTWLCQIGKNAWLQECKRKKRLIDRDVGEIEFSSSVQSLEMQIIRKEENKKILQEILKLKEPYRGVFMLRVFGEIRLKEIAEIYSKTEEWARVTYYRAKNKIVKAMEDENETIM